MKNKIILDIYNSNVIQNYCRTLSPTDFEELKSELIIQLYKMSEDKLINHFENNCLTYICFTIIKRIKYGTISDTGVFYKKLDLMSDIPTSGDFSGDGWENTMNSFEGTIEAKQEQEDLFANLESSIQSLHWYHKTLFDMYYTEDMTLKMISEKTGINIKSIHYSLKVTRQQLKKILKKND